jgi:endonuclease/exonuclease/phosphatase (EEP) superfamily protein YafD
MGLVQPEVSRTHERDRYTLGSWWRGLRDAGFLVSTAAWLTLAYGASATALYAAGQIAGDATGWLYVSNILSFYWLTPAVGLLAVAVTVRWPVPAVACVIPAVAWAVTFGPMFVPNAVSTASNLRVVSYNMHGDPDAPGVEHVVRLIARTAPDVVLLQEVAPFSRQPLVDTLSTRLPYHHFSKVNPTAPAASGTAVLSRLPIRNIRPVTGLPASSRPTDVVTLDMDERPLAVISLHMITPDDGCKTGSLADCLSSVGQLGRDAAVRRREMDRVLAALPAGPVVVGGDLNSSTLNSPRRQLIEAGLVDLHRAVGAGPGFTAERARLAFRIDWLFASTDVAPVHEWVGSLDKSDHRPLIADVVLRPADGASSGRPTPHRG